MGIPVNPAIAAGRPCQHKNGGSIGSEAYKAAVGSVQRSGRGLLNAKSEINGTISIGGKRRVDEDSVVESVATAGVCAICGEVSVEALLNGSVRGIRVGIINVVHSAAGAGIVEPCARGGRRKNRLIRRDPVKCRQYVVSGQRVFQSPSCALEGIHLETIGGPNRHQDAITRGD